MHDCTELTENAQKCGIVCGNICNMLGCVFSKVKVHPCTGTEALYRPYSP